MEQTQSQSNVLAFAIAFIISFYPYLILKEVIEVSCKQVDGLLA